MQIDAELVSEQRAVARIAGAVAHELNNPLQGVLSLVGVTLRECRLDQRCQSRLEQIQRGVTRLTRTVESLSAIYENLPRPPDLVLLSKILTSLSASLAESGFHVRGNAPSSDVKARCFAPEVVRLIRDIVLEHSAAPRHIRLTAERYPEEVLIECEIGEDFPFPNLTDDWQVPDRHSGVSGIAILLDEIVKLSRGRVEFRWHDSELTGLRLWMSHA